MRLLFLSHSPNDELGGASRIYHMLASALIARGHQVDLHHMEDMGLPRNRHARLAAMRLMMPRMVSRFGATRSPASFDVVMSSSGMAAPLFARLRRQATRPLLVNHLHGLAVYDHVAALTEHELGHDHAGLAYRLVNGPVQNRWDARGIATADLTIVQNERDLGWVRPRLPRGRRLVMIPAAIHDALLTAAETITPLEDRAQEIVWFASWGPRKGSHYVPAAFRMIRAAVPDVRLTIGGTGMKRETLLAYFDERDRAAITILPRISIEEQIRIFNRAAIFLMPSLSEGFGLALAEAMSLGLASISCATGFAADFLTDRIDARIVAPSSEHIGRAAVDLLRDPRQRVAIALKGRDVARSFTVERMTDGYEQAFADGSAMLPLGDSRLA